MVIFHSAKENEEKYYLVEPHVTEIEADLEEFLSRNLKTAIKYSSDEVVVEGGDGVHTSYGLGTPYTQDLTTTERLIHCSPPT